MHIEILIEDQSGKALLDIALQHLVSSEHTHRVHAYRGIGHIPKDLKNVTDANKRVLLDQLPRLLRGYGAAFANYPPEHDAAVVVVCDLDKRNKKAFLTELNSVLAVCSPKPKTFFCLAIEEGEAWLLGDFAAIKKAYPNAKQAVLSSYKNDSICGTWEKLADAVYPGGSAALLTKGRHIVGTEKSRWAIKIAPHMDFSLNRSPSFCFFRDIIYDLQSSGAAEE